MEENDDKIISLFGPNKVVKAEEEVKEFTAADILERVGKAEFDKVLVIGIDEHGYLGFSTNLENAAQVNWVLDKFKVSMLTEDMFD